MRTFSDPLRNLDAQCARVIGYSECGCGHDECDLWEAPIHLRDPNGIPPFPAFSTDIADARLLEDEIERRGLQEAYIRALLPEYHSFEAMTPNELFAFLRAAPERRARAFLEAVKP